MEALPYVLFIAALIGAGALVDGFTPGRDGEPPPLAVWLARHWPRRR